MAQPSSIRSRIAALNLEEVHTLTPDSQPAYKYEQATAKKKTPPPPPPGQRPNTQQRQPSTNNASVASNGPTVARGLGSQPTVAKPDTPKASPALPPRPPPRTTPSQAPSLPPRKSSDHSLQRRDSNESVSTVASGVSSLSLGSAKYGHNSNGANNGGSTYRVRAPAYDPASLPPLPTKKAPEDPQQSKGAMKAMHSPNNIVKNKTLPPQLPSRPPLPSRNDTEVKSKGPPQPPPRTKTEPPPPRAVVDPPPRRSALEFGMNKASETPPPIPTSRPPPSPAPAPAPTPTPIPTSTPGSPPPIPLASRPNLDAIMASKPKPGATASCLKCRDFSEPDHHAAQFPRESLPSSDVAWLAAQLTSPFPSPTDKARAIFTWLHHNVDYDAHSFFGGTVTKSTPERTITSGLAVCEGYAGLFCALALKAGLECVVVSGHGKGYSHKPLQPGDPIPPFKCGHAWNAVRIDNGEWKLVDPCWGAGALNNQRTYSRGFTPSQFTADNNEFGMRHFPEDDRYFFRTDGRQLSWEEYLKDDMGERLTVYGCATKEHAIGPRTFQPAMKHISVYDQSEGPAIRFMFANVCEHWDHERNGKGKPYVMTLSIGGRDGRNTQMIPFNTNGKVYWLDVNRLDLGAPGQKVKIDAITTISGSDARGISNEDFIRAKGKKAMSWSGVAMWELV